MGAILNYFSTIVKNRGNAEGKIKNKKVKNVRKGGLIVKSKKLSSKKKIDNGVCKI